MLASWQLRMASWTGGEEMLMGKHFPRKFLSRSFLWLIHTFVSPPYQQCSCHRWFLSDCTIINRKNAKQWANPHAKHCDCVTPTALSGAASVCSYTGGSCLRGHRPGSCSSKVQMPESAPYCWPLSTVCLPSERLGMNCPFFCLLKYRAQRFPEISEAGTTLRRIYREIVKRNFTALWPTPRQIGIQGGKIHCDWYYQDECLCNKNISKMSACKSNAVFKPQTSSSSSHLYSA